MRKLPKEKQQQLLLAILVTGIVLTGLGYGLIRAQWDTLRKLDGRRQSAQGRFEQVKRAIDHADQIECDLAQAKKQIDHLEENFANPSDLYSWAINMLRTTKAGYKVEIPQFSQVDGPKAVTLLPNFPYSQASITVAGTAKFHELGRFLADFENQNPYFRLVNLSVEPASGPAQTDGEVLSFRVEIVTLVKPSAS